MGFRVFSFGHFLGWFFSFALKNIAFSVLLSIAVSGIFSFFSIWFLFVFFWARIKQVRFLCLSLCSHMLGYFKISFYFTVNPGQTAIWDSGVLIEVYTYRRAFCKRKISLIGSLYTRA